MKSSFGECHDINQMHAPPEGVVPVPMLRLAALACLTATAASLTTFRPLRGGLLSRGSSTLRPRNHAASRTPLIQLHALAAGWEAQVDEASGQTYYIKSQTGESQWEPPQ